MKKAVSIFAVLALCLSLVSCTSGGNAATSQTPITSPGGISVNLPEKAVMYTENGTVSDKIYAYTLLELYRAFCENLGSASLTAEDIGITSGTCLGEQKYTLGDTFDTWLEYFSEQAEYSLTERLVLCEAARDAGISLDESDTESIDETLKSLTDSANSENLTLGAYLTAHCGVGTTSGDVRSAAELSLLAEKYLNSVADKADTSGPILESYYLKNERTFESVDFLVYVFASDESSYAENLAQYTTSEDFLEYLHYYITTVQTLDEDDFNEILEKHVICENITRDDDDETVSAAFEAKEGECVTLRDNDKITVILVTRSRGRNTKKNESGIPMWEAEVTNAIRSLAIENATKKAAQSYPVTIDREEIGKIDITP